MNNRNDIAASAQSLSKRHTVSRNTGRLRYATAGAALTRRIRHRFERLDRERFRAPRDVSFDVPRGEAVGIVGGAAAPVCGSD